MAKGSSVRVEVSCDNMGVCCAEHKGKKFCGQDYKFPFDQLGLTKRQRGEAERGYTVRKNIGRFTWFDMADAWSDGGLFGARRRRRRR